jgi:nitrite reductase (NO-forming)
MYIIYATFMIYLKSSATPAKLIQTKIVFCVKNDVEHQYITFYFNYLIKLYIICFLKLLIEDQVLFGLMNRNVFAGIFASVLAVGLLLGPTLSGITPTADAQAQQNATQGQQGTAGNPMQKPDYQPTGKIKPVLLLAQEVVVDVAPDNALHPGGIKYNAMTFNGTVPAPVIAVDQGDTLRVTLRNDGETMHSLDFHAGWGPSEATGSGTLRPGESKTWDIKADIAGAFMYHCGADGLNGVWEHIANGMYGMIVVHPQNEKPAKEFYLVMSELYNTADQGPFKGANTTGSFDLVKFINKNPDLVLTNGMAHKYVPSIGTVAKLDLNKNAEVFKVKPGELTRWYVLNPGPNGGTAFHFISGMNTGVHDGFIKNRLGTQVLDDETYYIPAGQASVIESTFPEEGIYVGVDHEMTDVVKGGAVAVLAANNSTASDHPAGTWVPPKGSPVAAASPTNPGNATATGTPEEAKLPAEQNATGSGANTTITEGVSPNVTASQQQ